MVDEILIMRKLSKLDEYLGQLSEYAAVTHEEYQKDWKVQRIVERTLQIMIETCLDVAGHIISDERFRVPETYAEMFEVLAENGIIKESLLEGLVKMARFRNIIVHQYEAIEAAIVIGILRDHLKDFKEFQWAILSYLKKAPPKNET